MLAQAYRDAVLRQDPELVDIARHGVAATEVGRRAKGGLKHSSFGITPRLAIKSCQKAAQQALWHRTAHLMPAERALALADQGAPGVAPAAAVAASVSTARSHQRMDGMIKAKQREDDAKALAHYHATKGSESVHKLLEALPFLTADMVVSIPLGQIPCFDIQPYGNQKAVQGCAWACAASKRSNVGPCLEEGWAEDHKTVMHSSCPAVEADAPLSTPCRDAGICICSGEGLELYRFRNAILKNMKLTFKNTSKRALLAEGFIVAHFVNMGAAAGQGHPMADAGIGGPALEDLWLHVGMQYFSPYRPTFHRMLQVEDPGLDDGTSWTYLKVISKPGHYLCIKEQ